jgi:hypothetical protein
MITIIIAKNSVETKTPKERNHKGTAKIPKVNNFSNSTLFTKL